MNNTYQYSTYRIERLGAHHLGDVEKLYAAVYDIAPPAGYFHKKYDTSYTGVSFLGFIAYDAEGMPAAFRGMISCFLQYEDKIILSAQSVDTMTHPGHRGRGLYVRLSALTLNLCREAGIRIVFGFFNQSSYALAVKHLDWKETVRMECFAIKVKTLPLEHIAKKCGGRHLYEKYRLWVLSKYRLQQSCLVNSAIGEGYGGLCRDARYWQYKARTDTAIIAIGKSKLWIKVKNGLQIGDIELRENNFDELIEKIKKIAQKLGVQQIFFHTSPHTRLHAMFAGRYKSFPSFPVLFQDFETGISPGRFKFTLADTDIF